MASAILAGTGGRGAIAATQIAGAGPADAEASSVRCNSMPVNVKD